MSKPYSGALRCLWNHCQGCQLTVQQRKQIWAQRALLSSGLSAVPREIKHDTPSYSARKRESRSGNRHKTVPACLGNGNLAEQARLGQLPESQHLRTI